MSVTLLKTRDINLESYSIQVDTSVKVHENNGNNITNLGELLKIVCFKELSEADVFLDAGRTYKVRGTICIQDVTEDETTSTES